MKRAYLREHGRAGLELIEEAFVLLRTSPLAILATYYLGSVPFAAAGSGTPQCAVMGWPGHTGHTSPAALSQTVRTKSICGASGLANSSQFLLRYPSVGMRNDSSVSRANGFTLPFG